VLVTRLVQIMPLSTRRSQNKAVRSENAVFPS